MTAARLLLPLLTFSSFVQAERMSWLENDRIKLGVDLDRGGAITFLADVKDGANVINNYDLGRQVQLSFFSGPVPFEAQGQKPAEHWRHIGWNPIQTGDDFKNASRILSHENDGKRIHVSCVPLQWPLNHVPGECSFDSWLELDGSVVKARARLTNTRSDATQYPARLQELPAVYANAAFHRVVSYMHDKPFTQDAVSTAPAPHGKHPWSFWPGTECWAALLDEHDYGLGLITPGRVHFTGGFAGKPGPNDTHGNSTGYLAGQGQEILDHNIVYDFAYELVLGNLQEIRTRAAVHRVQGTPAWSFAQDRQGWHYQNASDSGWPVKDCLSVVLEQDDPQLISPMTFWQAADAPSLIIDAAFHTQQKQGTVMWQSFGQKGFSAANLLTFPLVADGHFHRHVIPLSSAASYQGGMLRLRIDPVGSGEPGAWMKVRSIRLAASEK
ncbi:hypothetical protein [Prosthecobacter sp.]|uniref:hypothetical protein n=1 Tax=Prosthecobacter sp. TaxID=1965333 RepID=UPI0037841219